MNRMLERVVSRLLLVYYGHCVNLDEPLGTHQPLHNHQRTRRRIRSVHEFVAYLADDWDLSSVDRFSDVDVQLDDVARVAAGRFHCGLQVLEYLLRLCAKIIFSYKIARSIERDLSRNIDDLAAGYLGDLRVSHRRFC